MYIGCFRFAIVPQVSNKCVMDCCRWRTTKLPTRFDSMSKMWVQASHATTADVQRELADQHGLSNIWLHVDPM
jgi:hypothetical protein